MRALFIQPHGRLWDVVDQYGEPQLVSVDLATARRVALGARDLEPALWIGLGVLAVGLLVFGISKIGRTNAGARR